MLTPNEFILILRVVMPLCPFWRKSIKKCDRESADRQTDRQTDTRTYRDKLNLQSALCYAIAMGQIITLIYCRIAEIPTSYRKSRSRNTMVTSDFRSEVEIRQFRARAL